MAKDGGDALHSRIKIKFITLAKKIASFSGFVQGG